MPSPSAPYDLVTTAENNMRCSKCGREAFLLSTAQKWLRDNWLVTEKFYCSSCGTMYVLENGEIWQIPVKQ